VWCTFRLGLSSPYSCRLPRGARTRYQLATFSQRLGVLGQSLRTPIADTVGVKGDFTAMDGTTNAGARP
jgi:hypothetical protein